MKGSEERDETGGKKEARRGGQEILREGQADKGRKLSRPEERRAHERQACPQIKEEGQGSVGLGHGQRTCGSWWPGAEVAGASPVRPVWATAQAWSLVGRKGIRERERHAQYVCDKT